MSVRRKASSSNSDKRNMVIRKQLHASHLFGTNLERAGDHNQRVVLHAVRVHAPITRPELSALTGLTMPAIANIVSRLLNDEYLLEAGRIEGARGQPATKLALNPDCCFAVGFTIDRDHVAAVLVDFKGRVRARVLKETRFAMPATVRAFCKQSIDALLRDAKIASRKVIGIGVAFPDDIEGAALPGQPRGYAKWRDVDIPAVFAGLLPVPVTIENDATAAAMGELQFGLGQQHASFFYILITAGLGGGLVIDGHLVRGAQGRSSEIGLLPVQAMRGKRVQAQAIVSISALHERFARNGCEVRTPSDLNDLDRTGRRVLKAWIDEAARILADTLIPINCLINPAIVLIGGRLPGPLVDTLATRVNELLAEVSAQLPAIAPVRRATMSDDAPAVGAATLAFNREFLPIRESLTKAGAPRAEI